MSASVHPNVNETVIEADVEAEIDVTALLRGLAEGTLTGRAMTIEQRRACVGQLLAEGFTTAEMVSMLQSSERTITRDRAEIGREQAVEPDRRLGDRLLGQYQAHVENVIARLTRLSRDAEAPEYSRLWADEAITRIYHKFLETARKMDYFTGGDGRLRAQEAREQAEYEKQQKATLGRRPFTPAERAHFEGRAMYRMLLEKVLNDKRVRAGEPPLEDTLQMEDVMDILDRNGDLSEEIAAAEAAGEVVAVGSGSRQE